MQKIIKQDLGGGEEEANKTAEYTWQKDETAWYFCSIYNDVFKVKFTGKHWLIGNKWGRYKVYQFEYVESSKKDYVDNLKYRPEDERFGNYEEYYFFTDKSEAIEQGVSSINRKKKNLIKDLEEDLERLLAY